jgi:hypothetical protein
MPIALSFSQPARPAVGIAFSIGIGQLGNFVLAEVPGGAVDDVNTAYTTLADYAKLWVFKNGVRMKPGEDYAEDGGNDFHFLYPPTTGDLLIVDYIT